MKSILNFPPPPPPPLCPLTLTDHTQANTRGMLIMPAHDISKISPPILFKQLSVHARVPRCTLARWPDVCYFQCGGWAGLAALLLPPFLFPPLEGDFSASGTKVELCLQFICSLFGTRCSPRARDFQLLLGGPGLRGRSSAVGIAVIYHALKPLPSRWGRVKVEARWFWFNIVYKETGMNSSNKQHGGS